jgi:hypothetical protein
MHLDLVPSSTAAAAGLPTACRHQHRRRTICTTRTPHEDAHPDQLAPCPSFAETTPVMPLRPHRLLTFHAAARAIVTTMQWKKQRHVLLTRQEQLWRDWHVAVTQQQRLRLARDPSVSQDDDGQERKPPARRYLQVHPPIDI